MPLEDLEHSPQKSVREQHARSRHLDQNDVGFARDRAHRPMGRVESDTGSLSFRLPRIVDEDGNAKLHGGRDRVRMQDLCPERSELGRLVESDFLYEVRTADNARVGSEHSVDVGQISIASACSAAPMRDAL